MTTSTPPKYYYSATMNGFYTTELFAVSDMPADAIEIDTSVHALVLEKQSQGYDIKPGLTGMPEISKPVDFPTPTSSALAHLRYTRNALLANLDISFIRNLETGTDNTAVVAEKNRLRDITKLVTPSSTVEEIDALRLSLAG